MRDLSKTQICCLIDEWVIGRNAKRDSMGRYSREDGYSYAEDDMNEIISDMRGIMSKLPADKQREVRAFIDSMERM